MHGLSKIRSVQFPQKTKVVGILDVLRVSCQLVLRHLAVFQIISRDLLQHAQSPNLLHKAPKCLVEWAPVPSIIVSFIRPC